MKKSIKILFYRFAFIMTFMSLQLYACNDSDVGHEMKIASPIESSSEAVESRSLLDLNEVNDNIFKGGWISYGGNGCSYDKIQIMVSLLNESIIYIDIPVETHGLPPDAIDMSSYAVECGLKRIQPRVTNVVDGDWSESFTSTSEGEIILSDLYIDEEGDEVMIHLTLDNIVIAHNQIVFNEDGSLAELSSNVADDSTKVISGSIGVLLDRKCIPQIWVCDNDPNITINAPRYPVISENTLLCSEPDLNALSTRLDALGSSCVSVSPL